MDCDVVVVGAGPVGSKAALKASETADTILVGIPSPHVRCAGVISKKGIESLGVAEGDYILNKVRGAVIHSPGGQALRVDAGRVKAHIIDRRLFDEYLFNQALDAGVRSTDGWVEKIKPKVVLSAGGQISYRRLVLAAGGNYTLQKQNNLDYPRQFLLSAQTQVDLECESDFVELYFNVPGFFSWIVPAGDTVRVGLATYTNPLWHLNRFLTTLGEEGRLKTREKPVMECGLIPFFDPAVKTQYGEILTVGDSAGHVKATSGGGIIYGCKAASYCMEENYEASWRRALEPELRLHSIIYRFIHGIKPCRLDDFTALVARYSEGLESTGDMDKAWETLLSLFRNPGFTAGFLRRTPGFLADLIHAGFF